MTKADMQTVRAKREREWLETRKPKPGDPVNVKDCPFPLPKLVRRLTVELERAGKRQSRPLVNSGARELYDALFGYAKPHNVCNPGQARLADDLGKSDRMVRRLLTQLEQHGLIATKSGGMARGREPLPATYTFLWHASFDGLIAAENGADGPEHHVPVDGAQSGDDGPEQNGIMDRNILVDGPEHFGSWTGTPCSDKSKESKSSLSKPIDLDLQSDFGKNGQSQPATTRESSHPKGAALRSMMARHLPGVEISPADVLEVINETENRTEGEALEVLRIALLRAEKKGNLPKSKRWFKTCVRNHVQDIARNDLPAKAKERAENEALKREFEQALEAF